jgi:PKHD-type hydroxylase
MIRETEPVGLKVDLPVLRPVDSGGGGWPLHRDRVENFAWNKDSFTSAELDALIKIGTNAELGRAATFGGSDPKIRDSFVQFLFPNEVTRWVFERLNAVVNAMNDEFFGFDLTSMDQGLQFTRYSAPGEHYEWHIDRGMLSGTRKLSLSLQLSDPDDYEGGDLELWFGGEPFKASRERGVMTLFPSWAMHRVTPVTQGVRYSLVCWVSGPSFK